MNTIFTPLKHKALYEDNMNNTAVISLAWCTKMKHLLCQLHFLPTQHMWHSLTNTCKFTTWRICTIHHCKFHSFHLQHNTTFIHTKMEYEDVRWADEHYADRNENNTSHISVNLHATIKVFLDFTTAVPLTEIIIKHCGERFT
jgi:hypothetical protein